MTHTALTNFKPLANRLVIDPIPIETKTKSGIYVAPSQAHAAPTQGVVVAAGPGLWIGDKLIPPTPQPGDLVCWNKFAGTEIRIKDKLYYVIRETDIIGVFTE